MIILSPSLLSVDFAHIAYGIAELDRAKVRGRGHGYAAP